MTDYHLHPEYAGFLAAVRAEPESDLPRLVAADWLEDHDPERAELIRLMCARQHASGPAAQRVTWAAKRAAGRVFAGMALPPGRVAAHTLFPPVSGRLEVIVDLGPDDGEWRESAAVITLDRGFAVTAECRADWLLAHGDAILAREPVSKVILTTWPEVEYEPPNHKHGDPPGWCLVGDIPPALLPLESVRDHPGGQVAGALAARWPGVEFELPELAAGAIPLPPAANSLTELAATLRAAQDSLARSMMVPARLLGETAVTLRSSLTAAGNALTGVFASLTPEQRAELERPAADAPPPR